MIPINLNERKKGKKGKRKNKTDLTGPFTWKTPDMAVVACLSS